MLLSVQQKYILEALRELKCLRRRQLCALLQGHFGWPDFETAQRRLDAMILQMRNGVGELSADAEFISHFLYPSTQAVIVGEKMEENLKYINILVTLDENYIPY